MGLRVAPDVLERHGAFYRLTLEQQADDHTAWVPDGAELQAVRNAEAER